MAVIHSTDLEASEKHDGSVGRDIVIKNVGRGYLVETKVFSLKIPARDLVIIGCEDCRGFGSIGIGCSTGLGGLSGDRVGKVGI